jgi:peptidyl-Asp metalloendopeptidase
MKRHPFHVPLLAAAALLLWPASILAAPPPARVIAPAERELVLPPGRENAARKSRRLGAVDLDLASLQRSAERGTAPRFVVGLEATLELFPGESHRFVGTRIEDGLHGVSTWVGRLLSETDQGEATLSMRGERVHATVEVGATRYVVEANGADSGWVREVDPRKEGRCLMDAPAGEPLPGAAKRGDPGQTPGTKGASLTSSTIDLLVLYTSGVESSYGEPWVQVGNFVANMNSAFSASGVAAAVRAVHMQEVAYSDPTTAQDFYDAIDDMRDENGVFYGLTNLRDQLDADLIVLLTQTGVDQEICGTAGDLGSGDTPLDADDLNDPGATAEYKAYAVTAIDCAAADHTFTHEIGHLLGGWHDLVISGTCGIGEQSCGHTNTEAPLRTLMGSGVAAVGFPCSTAAGCARVNRFSDPNESFFVGSNFWALGAGSHTVFAATLASTTPFVEDYRTPAGSAPGTPGSFTVVTCHGFQNLFWNASSGVPGWYEVEIDSSVSFTGPMLVYRGSNNGVYQYNGSPFYARVRACNAVGCSAWSTSGLNDPAYCI